MSDTGSTYTVSDYKIFEQSSAAVDTFVSSLDDVKTVISNAKKVISDESVFAGPIANSCIEATNDFDIIFGKRMEDFNSIKKYFNQIYDNYQKGDKNADKLILSKDDKGNIVYSSSLDVDKGDVGSIFNRFVEELKKNGLSDASAKIAACAMMGNAYRETGHTFDPTLVSPAGTSYGIFQWRNGSAQNDKRWDEVVNWCKSNGYDPNTLAGQIAFVAYDVTNGRYYDVGNRFRNAQLSEADISKLAEVFLNKYGGAKRDYVESHYGDIYDSRYLNPCVNAALAYYKKYVLGL